MYENKKNVIIGVLHIHTFFTQGFKKNSLNR